MPTATLRRRSAGRTPQTILNLCNIVTFILGCFVTVVVTRWWDVRQTYAAAQTATVELAAAACAQLRRADPPADAGADGDGAGLPPKSLEAWKLRMAQVC